MSVKGSVHSFETFGCVDGPGVRFVIFLNGCHMRCQYCHNVDTWSKKECNYTSDEVLAKAWKYHTYWKQDGGITLSGGEPLLQLGFALDLFTKAKERGIHTVLDTSANPFTREEPFFSKLEALMANCDLVLLDMKHIDEQKHQYLTGHSNQNILAFARYLASIQKPVWIRHVLVPGINDDEASLLQLDAFLSTLDNIVRVEVLPYHTMGAFKWEELGIPYPLQHVLPPDDTTIAKANAILHTNTYPGSVK